MTCNVMTSSHNLHTWCLPWQDFLQTKCVCVCWTLVVRAFCQKNKWPFGLLLLNLCIHGFACQITICSCGEQFRHPIHHPFDAITAGPQRQKPHQAIRQTDLLANGNSEMIWLLATQATRPNSKLVCQLLTTLLAVVLAMLSCCSPVLPKIPAASSVM